MVVVTVTTTVAVDALIVDAATVNYLDTQGYVMYTYACHIVYSVYVVVCVSPQCGVWLLWFWLS